MAPRAPKVRYVDYSPDEFLVGIAGMKAATIGVYWVVCSLLYSSGGRLAVDDERLLGLCGTSPVKLSAILEGLGAKEKLQISDGVIRHKRVDEVLERAQKRIGAWTKNLPGVEEYSSISDQNADDLSSISDRFAFDFQQNDDETSSKHNQNYGGVSSNSNDIAKPRAKGKRTNRALNYQLSTIKEGSKEERISAAAQPRAPSPSEDVSEAEPETIPEEAEKPPETPAGKTDQADPMFAIWRPIFQDIWPRVTKTPAALRVKLNARLNDTFDGELDFWRDFCEEVRRSHFLTGATDANFRAGLEWILKPANIAKIQAGNYDNPKPQSQGYLANGQRADRRPSPVDALVAGFARAAGYNPDGTDDR